MVRSFRNAFRWSALRFDDQLVPCSLSRLPSVFASRFLAKTFLQASGNSVNCPLKCRSRKRQITKAGNRIQTPLTKQRFGLPEGFVPRLQRYGRSVLLESNIYRLPNGQEFIPCHPTGTLGTHRHLYALLTSEQYLDGKRGSVYIRTDGRIFDYSIDHGNASGDLFDTGYTIYELERTGRYAPERRRKKKRSSSKNINAQQPDVKEKANRI